MDLFEDAAELGTALDLLETDSDDEPLAKKAKQKPAVRKNIRRRAAPPPAKPAQSVPAMRLPLSSWASSETPTLVSLLRASIF